MIMSVIEYVNHPCCSHQLPPGLHVTYTSLPSTQTTSHDVHSTSRFPEAAVGAPFNANKAKCPPTTGLAINGPSAKLCFVSATLFHSKAEDVLASLRVVKIGKSTVCRCLIDPFREQGNEHGLCSVRGDGCGPHFPVGCSLVSGEAWLVEIITKWD